MKRTLLIALLLCAPLANAVTVIVARPAMVSVARPVTVAPVARPTVTAPAAHATVEPVTAPVTRPVTPVMTPAIVHTYAQPRAEETCNRERHQTGDCNYK
jgi:hypothetical protein